MKPPKGRAASRTQKEKLLKALLDAWDTPNLYQMRLGQLCFAAAYKFPEYGAPEIAFVEDNVLLSKIRRLAK